MNYLAHLLLSGNSALEQLGNLAGDFAKGRLGDQYHPEIRKGLARHRAVDAYTDQHPVVRYAKARFGPHRRRVAGILVDLSFDHFLSNNWHRYSDQPLEAFVDGVYEALYQNGHLLPERLQRIAPVMMEQNWLLSYGSTDELGKTIDRVAGRLSKPELLLGGIEDIKSVYASLAQDFRAFFPDAVGFSQTWDRGYSSPSSTGPSSADPSSGSKVS